MEKRIKNSTNILDIDLTSIPMEDFSQLENLCDDKAFAGLKKLTPARIGIGCAGARYNTLSMLRFWADQQSASDAVSSEVASEILSELSLLEFKTRCKNKYEMVTRPDFGREFDVETQNSISTQCMHNPDVQIYVGDGLSSAAIEANIPDLLPGIIDALQFDGITVGTPFFVRYCRVNTARTVANILRPKVTVVLIGERPGLISAESMSAYIVYDATFDMSESKYSVISNISKKGMPAVEAAALIVDVIKAMLQQKASGYDLKL